GIGTPRWRESSGTASDTAGHSTDPDFSAHLPPAILLGHFSVGQGGAYRRRSWSQPPPPTHGANGAESQLNGCTRFISSTLKTKIRSKPYLSCLLILQIMSKPGDQVSVAGSGASVPGRQHQSHPEETEEELREHQGLTSSSSSKSDLNVWSLENRKSFESCYVLQQEGLFPGKLIVEEMN
ncbi:hypothetical protein GOODEAATRI_007566, partial [Goodea atripinnis]